MRLSRAGWYMLVVAVLAIAAGCTPRAAGGRAAPDAAVERMPRNIVGGHDILGTLVLNVEQTTRNDSVLYELFARWTGQARLEVLPGESLVITVDGRKVRFRASEKSIYHDMACDRGCFYEDRAYYPATEEQIRAMAEAQRVTVELIGRHGTIEREFNYLNFERFQEFVARYMKAPGARGEG